MKINSNIRRLLILLLTLWILRGMTGYAVYYTPSDFVSRLIYYPKEFFYDQCLYTTVEGRAIFTCPDMIMDWENETTGPRAGYYYGDIVIPDTVVNDFNDEKLIVANVADVRRNWMTSLTLPFTMERLSTIYECNYIEKIFMGCNIIGIKGVVDCPVLRECQLPVLLEEIKEESFNMLPSMTEFALPESLITVGQNCFNGCTGLRYVTLPSNDLNLTNCFNDSPGLSSLTVMAETPYEYPATCFLNIDKDHCILYVPEESVDLYRIKDGWRDFVNILPLVEADVSFDESIRSDFDVSVDRGSLFIDNKGNSRIDIFDINGRKIYSCGDSCFEMEVSKGVYVVSNMKKRIKVIVK